MGRLSIWVVAAAMTVCAATLAMSEWRVRDAVRDARAGFVEQSALDTARARTAALERLVSAQRALNADLTSERDQAESRLAQIEMEIENYVPPDDPGDCRITDDLLDRLR